MTSEATDKLDLDGLEEFLACTGHALVLGGPGSGKTTTSLVKANQAISSDKWKPFQQVIFLSFARSTIARVAEAAGSLVAKSVRKRVVLTTYHSFVWNLIRSHGYLIQSDPPLRLLPPHEAAVRLADVTKNAKAGEAAKLKDIEKLRLFEDEGLLDFDLFAGTAADLLERSEKIQRIVSQRYPLIFLDEFQDTNSSEYRFIRCLARHSRVIALADPEQRIYGFRGADPKRIEEFIDEFSPDTFDLAQRNHRSNGTDILEFADDLLSRNAAMSGYNDVEIQTFPPRKGPVQHVWMKTGVLKAIKRLRASQQQWSLAVLVPTKSMMLTVSGFLARRQIVDGVRRLPGIRHDVAVDAEGPSLAGVVIGRLMESNLLRDEDAARSFLDDLCGHIVGRKAGRSPSNAESNLIDGVRPYLNGDRVVGARRKRIVEDCERIVHAISANEFTGDPYADWISIRDIIAESGEPEIQCLATDAEYLRFLRKGANLRLQLSSLWQRQASYAGACQAVKNAFVQEHFAATSQEPRGVHVMTMHKSKGKEFDEVLVYEGTHRDRIVPRPDDQNALSQARLTLRVAVSRARNRVTILTPSQKPCELLASE